MKNKTLFMIILSLFSVTTLVYVLRTSPSQQPPEVFKEQEKSALTQPQTSNSSVSSSNITPQISKPDRSLKSSEPYVSSVTFWENQKSVNDILESFKDAPLTPKTNTNPHTGSRTLLEGSWPEKGIERLEIQYFEAQGKKEFSYIKIRYDNSNALDQDQTLKNLSVPLGTLTRKQENGKWVILLDRPEG